MKFLRSTFLYSGIILATSASAVMAQSTVSSSLPCPVIKNFMKIGVANDSGEVRRLQTFLSEHEGIAVDSSGIFDVQTEEAVKTFQRRYMSDIMGPWEATRPTGVVFISTIKKINQLVCGAPMTLNPDESSMISDYRRAAILAEAQDAATSTSEIAAAAPVVEDITLPISTSTNSTAAAGNTSLINRFIHFVADFLRN